MPGAAKEDISNLEGLTRGSTGGYIKLEGFTRGSKEG
jgi:hypothetical protein